jgi:AhpD family alkylhydroperoxidase
MDERIPYREQVPEAYEAMLSLEHFLGSATLGRTLLELVRLRVSQCNGCAYCVDLHSTQLLDEDVPLRKIFAVAAWRESPFFDDRERAALNVAEQLTIAFDEPMSKARFDTAYEAFTETELVELTTAVIAINGWNRLWLMFRTPAISPLSDSDSKGE